VPLSDLIDQRRPHRADAARNFDAILAAARAGFTDSGTEASLENMAAGPGSDRRRCTATSPPERTSSRPSTLPRSTRCAKTQSGWRKPRSRGRRSSPGYDTSSHTWPPSEYYSMRWTENQERSAPAARLSTTSVVRS
jgi:hypothetical protein